MKRLQLCLLVFALTLALPVLAQNPAAPSAVNDALWASLVGEWEGWSESAAMGRSEDEVEIEWELQHQFLKTKVSIKSSEGTYKGVGYATIDPKTGEMGGYWFDSDRMTFKTKETRAGNKFTIVWQGPTTFERTYEKVGEDKLVGTYKVTQPDGKVVEGKSELTRKRKAAKQ